jgi:hypothetical protein
MTSSTDSRSHLAFHIPHVEANRYQCVQVNNTYYSIIPPGMVKSVLPLDELKRRKSIQRRRYYEESLEKNDPNHIIHEMKKRKLKVSPPANKHPDPPVDGNGKSIARIQIPMPSKPLDVLMINNQYYELIRGWTHRVLPHNVKTQRRLEYHREYKKKKRKRETSTSSDTKRPRLKKSTQNK